MRLFFTLFLLIPLANAVADGDIDITPAFDEASQAYAADDFATAIEILEAVREAQPECAECTHLLAKSYGRLAEQSSWVSAVKLAKKSRIAFEHAVALDPTNVHALEDLIKFYRAAPAFLGGGEDKAEKLERRLQTLRADRTS